jgi:hypothetical protein
MLKKNIKITFTIILGVFCIMFLSNSAIAADNEVVQDELVLQGTASDFSAIYTVSPSEQIQEIIDFYDDGITSGNLSGTGLTEKVKQNREKAFGNMLANAQYLIDNEYTEEACTQLMSAYKKVDNTILLPPDFIEGSAAPKLAGRIKVLIANYLLPPDFIEGSAAPELASKINVLIQNLNCM